MSVCMMDDSPWCSPGTCAACDNARPKPHDQRCTEIADKVVPEYRDGKRSYSCGGHTAKRWQAAWDAASVALRGHK